jgi:hypothetical protein
LLQSSILLCGMGTVWEVHLHIMCKTININLA